MRKRTVLAAAILAALPLAAGTLQADPARPADADRTQGAVEQPDGPRWIYITGERSHLPNLLTCPAGAWRCALYAL